MKSVIGAAVTKHLAEDVGAARFRMFQGFEDQHGRTFTHYKAISVFIERSRSMLRVGVIRA